MCAVHVDLLGGAGGHAAHDLAHQVLFPVDIYTYINIYM